jgi:D-alanyl-lipoteichoic acid acyltransferase DltB (MBOAT superfamily)
VSYALFLAVAVGVYFALPGARSRTAWLLVASYAFYYTLSASWTLILLGVTVLGYATGLILERSRTDDAGVSPDAMPKTTRALLAVGVSLVVGLLVVFKYAGFAGELFATGAGLLGLDVLPPSIALALPVGISFWTFQTIAYLVDVARGTSGAERDPLRYALFIAFFGHVTSGPIARAGQLLPQLAGKRRFSFEHLRSGLLLMGWGFFKKLLVADPLGVIVGRVFGDPRAFGDSGAVLAFAALAFAVQIYFDFSGYTDIVRGSARLFGIRLMPNFLRPYAATSIKDFWRRWHMTLMSWLRDYIYIPLGGSRVSRLRRYANIVAVFAISGIWHGAGLTFLVWGLLNAAYQIAGEFLAPVRERLAAALGMQPDSRTRNALRIMTTFALTTVAWVFFRAGSLGDAGFILARILTPSAWAGAQASLTGLGLGAPQLALALGAAAFAFAVEGLGSRTDLPAFVYRRPLLVRWALYQALLLSVLVFGYYGPGFTAADFVYFKF